MVEREAELTCLQKQVEELRLALSHPEIQKVPKEKMDLESGEIPHESQAEQPQKDPHVETFQMHESQYAQATPHKPQVVLQPQREAHVGTPRVHEIQQKAKLRPMPSKPKPQEQYPPDSFQFSFMRDLDDIVPPEDMFLEKLVQQEVQSKPRLAVNKESRGIKKKHHKKNSHKLKTSKSGDKDVKFEFFNGRRDNDKDLAFIRQFEVAFAEGNLKKKSKLRHVCMYLKGVKETQASLFLKLNRSKAAEEAYLTLLDINSENYRYHEGLQRSLGIFIDNACQGVDVQSELTLLYSNLQIKYPKSVAVKRIPLDFLEIGLFRLAVDTYMRPLLRKGVPSLFSDLKSLYAQPNKADVLEEILLNFENSLRSSGTFPESSEREAPSTLLWTLFLLAQHFDRRGFYDKALQKIDEAILHTPTVIDLYLVKGRIFKHAGDLVAAAALADEARSMDLADRFLNSECVKRMLQADQVEQAEKTALLFTKDGDQHNNLYDMQCMWYELASGDSYCRQGLLGKALKKYLAVEKHYADMVEDQFDFHTYCIRKMTLRAYIRMLRFQDRLHSHRFFHRAASSAIRCYIRLFDSPPRSAAEEEEAAVVGLAPAERKKLRQKQRKEAARAKKEAEEKAKEEESASLSASKGGKKGSQQPKPTDTDPHGDKLVQVEDPLGEATKYLKLLQDHSAELLETHLLAFEIYIRKNKFLLALQALKRQLNLGADSPEVHRSIIRFFNAVDKLPASEAHSDKLVFTVINLERACFKCLESKTLIEANEDFLNRHKDSLRHRSAAAEVLHLLSPEQKRAAVEILETSICRPCTSGGLVAEGVGKWGLKDCSFVYETLANSLNDLDAASSVKASFSSALIFSCFGDSLKSLKRVSVSRNGSETFRRYGGGRNGISDNYASKIRKAATFLKTNVLQWWTTSLNQRVVPSTWVCFKQIFAPWITNTFEIDVMTAWNQLSAVNCESLEECNAKVWDALLPMSSFKIVPLAEQIEKYCCGLPKGIKKYCTKTSVMNMAQLMENAKVKWLMI
ncbi:hypothetical protein L7F22_048690 [Adiantum nelumboides]|nr:hypothetical protein [Adiantum nelumboides]